MKLDKVANSGNDEFYTPYYAIEPLLKYIKLNSTIWCPFTDPARSFSVASLVADNFECAFYFRCHFFSPLSSEEYNTFVFKLPTTFLF